MSINFLEPITHIWSQKVVFGQLWTLMVLFVLWNFKLPYCSISPVRYQILADIESFAFLFITKCQIPHMTISEGLVKNSKHCINKCHHGSCRLIFVSYVYVQNYISVGPFPRAAFDKRGFFLWQGEKVNSKCYERQGVVTVERNLTEMHPWAE